MRIYILQFCLNRTKYIYLFVTSIITIYEMRYWFDVSLEKQSFVRKNGSDSFFPSKLHFSCAKLHFSIRNFIFPYKTSFFHTKLHFSTRNYIFLHETSFFHTKIPAQRVSHQITNKILTQILLLSNSTSNQ